jgi:hypothetical protein
MYLHWLRNYFASQRSRPITARLRTRSKLASSRSTGPKIVNRRSLFRDSPPAEKGELFQRDPAAGAGRARVIVFLPFFRQQRRELGTTNIIGRCFVEVRRRPRSLLCFVSVDRIVYFIFQRFNLEWENHTPSFLHKQVDITSSLETLSTLSLYEKITFLFAQLKDAPT